MSDETPSAKTSRESDTMSLADVRRSAAGPTPTSASESSRSPAMNVKLLIDGIVRQTTVLIAQLSTAAGVRAPLSHVADQVFLSLAKEIEAQGVGRKVVADMFGMALRAYQKKVQRLAESSSFRERTLWEGVLDFITDEGTVVRSRVLDRFQYDGERETIAVLGDLVNSGLIYASGRGAATLYGVTTEAERQRLVLEADAASVQDMVWGWIYRNPNGSPQDIRRVIRCTDEQLEAALAQLAREGRVQIEGQGETRRLQATNFLIRVGTERGWESAVFDHFQAVTSAIGAKLHGGRHYSQHGDTLGGSTLRFQIERGHPYEAKVLGLLSRLRRELDAFWQEVSDYNDAHPIDPTRRVDVCFYFGQGVHSNEDDAETASENDET